MSELLERHPLSALWGDMPEWEYEEFVESVQEHGFADPYVWLLDGQVLDGWHRYRTAQELSKTEGLIFRSWDGGDPVQYVIRKNLHRRHLTASQRAAMVVACHEWQRAGRPEKGDGPSPFSTVPEMAEEAGVSERTIQRAKVASEAGLGEAVQSGELSAEKATERARGDGIADMPKEPTKTERLQAEIATLEAEIQGKAQKIDDLTAEIQFLKGQMSEYPHEQYTQFHSQRAEISALRSSVADYQMKYADLQQKHQGALRRLRALEGAES